jgi:hypothetical protein
VFAAEDGNLTASTTGGTQKLPNAAQTLTLSSIPAGTPTSGQAWIRTPAQLITYSGISGNTLEGVSGGEGSILNGDVVHLEGGTGGPEPELNADQRRTVYSYFSYLLSDAAQSTEASYGYQQLPESWITSLRGEFQASF